MFPGPTELRLIGCSIESIWTQKNPNQVHRHQKPTCRLANQGKFHVTNGIIFCVCSTLANSVLQFVLKQWQKEYNKIQGKRVTAKSRPMMNLVARVPSTLASSASESEEKKSYESQFPLSSRTEQHQIPE